MRRLFLSAALMMAASSAASAQQASVWSGDAGWRIEGEARVNTGQHGVGDAAMEVDLSSTRTGTIVSDISLTSERYGPLVVHAGTPLTAFHIQMSIQEPGKPTQYVPAGLQWCTATLSTHICIVQPDVIEAILSRQSGNSQPLPYSYVEYRQGSTRLSRDRSGRFWSGPEPTIREDSVAFADAVHRRLTIRQISSVGVTVSNDMVEGAYVAQGPSSLTIPFGIKVHGGDDFAGAAVTFMPADNGHVVVTNTPPQPGEIEIHQR